MEYASVTRLLLAADREDQHRVEFSHVSIESDIPPCSATDHELPELRPHGSTESRAALQHIDCLNDVPNARWRVRHLMLKQMIQDAIEIVPYLWRELDPRHD